jgi:hypothetical protein
MACSGCAFTDTADRQFTQQKAEAEMIRYRQKGPRSRASVRYAIASMPQPSN